MREREREREEWRERESERNGERERERVRGMKRERVTAMVSSVWEEWRLRLKLQPIQLLCLLPS